MGGALTSPLIHSNGGAPILTSSPVIWKNSFRVSWEISPNPDLTPHLSNHDLNLSVNLGDFSVDPAPPAQWPPAPASFLPIILKKGKK